MLEGGKRVRRDEIQPSGGVTRFLDVNCRDKVARFPTVLTSTELTKAPGGTSAVRRPIRISNCHHALVTERCDVTTVPDTTINESHNR